METAVIDRARFLAEIDVQGYSIVENVLEVGQVARAKEELARAIEEEATYHRGMHYPDYGMVLLCALYGGVFIDILAHPPLIEPFDAVLGTGCIIYAYTSSSMPPHGANYSHRIHCDCPRLIPGYVTNVGATILLDDFTEENGATYYLPGSHTRPDAPGEEEFFRGARRLVARAGTVFYFNARLWHMGGQNRTGAWRHALTINMCRPYMKQRLDVPRAMAHMDLGRVPEPALQKLGFLAQVPASYDEYYQPPERRKYRQPTE
jgi:ectoine hydroxylase-related dioxygenase (phytanoyl-CoA dioxygenase family)